MHQFRIGLLKVSFKALPVEKKRKHNVMNNEELRFHQHSEAFRLQKIASVNGNLSELTSVKVDPTAM